MDVNPKTQVSSKPYKGHYVGNKFFKVFIPMIHIHIHIPKKIILHGATYLLLAFAFALDFAAASSARLLTRGARRFGSGLPGFGKMGLSVKELGMH